MTTTVIRCRGIGEPQDGRTMLHGVTDQLDADQYRPIELPWSAQYGPVPDVDGESFDTALASGQRQLLEAITDANGPVVLLGYSGGAMLAGNVAAELGRNHGPLTEKIKAVALVADPAMPPGHAPAGAYGVTGARDIDHLPTEWLWNSSDPIPAAPPRSPLRTIADQTAAMSLVDPAAWTRDLLHRLHRGKWQQTAINWRDPVGTWRRYSRAAEQATFYLSGGHVDAYRGQPLRDLARWVEATA